MSGESVQGRLRHSLRNERPRERFHVTSVTFDVLSTVFHGLTADKNGSAIFFENYDGTVSVWKSVFSHCVSRDGSGGAVRSHSKKAVFSQNCFMHCAALDGRGQALLSAQRGRRLMEHRVTNNAFVACPYDNIEGHNSIWIEFGKKEFGNNNLSACEMAGTRVVSILSDEAEEVCTMNTVAFNRAGTPVYIYGWTKKRKYELSQWNIVSNAPAPDFPSKLFRIYQSDIVFKRCVIALNSHSELWRIALSDEPEFVKVAFDGNAFSLPVQNSPSATVDISHLNVACVVEGNV